MARFGDNGAVDPLFVLRLVARSWLLPPSGLLLLALLGVVLVGRLPRLGRALAAAGIVGLIALSLPVVADPLSRLVERYPPLDLSRPIDAQAIVVLAGGVRRGPGPGTPYEPNAITLERIAMGVEVARRTGLPLLLSGGTVMDGPPEAEAMASALDRYFGLHARWLETRSRTTGENARYSAEMLRADGVRRIVLVTTANHMPRAVAQFRAYGLDVVPAPAASVAGTYDGFADWLPNVGSLQRSSHAIYELAGMVVTAPRAPAAAVR
jgi:uncharacterized SAM-binding protein YcdF (DUF218 family)